VKLLVIGAKGSIGKRRFGILEDLGHKVKGVDVETPITPKLVKEYDATFICTPPNTEVDLALQCVGAEKPFFLEKPGAVDFRDFLALSSKCANSDIPNMVSCNLRFTNEFKAIQDSLPNLGKPMYATAEFGYFLPFWRPGEYRTYYSCYRVAGGGVILDAIHEFDYVTALFGMPKQFKAVMAKTDNSGEMEGLEVEDSASLFLIYKNGPAVSIHVTIYNAPTIVSLALSERKVA
jgi:predicted dehydrogenase